MVRNEDGSRKRDRHGTQTLEERDPDKQVKRQWRKCKKETTVENYSRFDDWDKFKVEEW